MQNETTVSAEAPDISPRALALQVLLGACAAGLLLWAVRAEFSTPRSPPSRRGVVQDTGILHAAAFTNEGTPIPLAVARIVALERADTEVTAIKEAGLEGRAMRTAPSDQNYSCHGWVFTRLRCHLPGWAVDLILKENGYEEACNAGEGDLVIYRDHAGEVVHSGIVRSVEGADEVRVESKWGLYGRYLHRPEDQIYGTDYSFYRSRREGHLLQGLPDSVEPVP